VILTASPAPLPVMEIAARAGSSPYPYRVLHGARLTQLLAAARPFTDQESEPSPAPPADMLFG
jgi:hypothetical protein